jgi:hypothetical protein
MSELDVTSIPSTMPVGSPLFGASYLTHPETMSCAFRLDDPRNLFQNLHSSW